MLPKTRRTGQEPDEAEERERQGDRKQVGGIMFVRLHAERKK